MATNTNLKWEAAKQADSASQASKVVNALTIQLNGTSQGAYNGSAAKTVNITPSSIGAATSGHSHSNYSLSTHEHSNYMRFRGVVANDAAIDTAFAPGYYYLNGGKYSLLGDQPQYGWLVVYSNNGAQNQAVTQRLHIGGVEYARLFAGYPGQWGVWTLMLTEFNYTSRITPQSIGAAATNHSHSNYASTNHTHDIYLEIKGTPITTQSLDDYRAPGLYYINGKYMPMFSGNYWGWLMVVAKPTSWGQGGTTQQIMFNAYSFLMRDYSGEPAAWTQWRRLDNPIQVIQQDYGNQTVASGNAWRSSGNTINYSGIWLVSGCTYSNEGNKHCDYGVFQSTCVVNGTTWLLGNQTLNRAIGKPGVGGSILLWLNKGDTLALRTYYMSSSGGSINTGYNILRAIPVSIQ